MTYKRLTRPGEWRLTLRLLGSPQFRRVVDVYNEGTVYRYWIAWLFVKVMVKSRTKWNASVYKTAKHLHLASNGTEHWIFNHSDPNLFPNARVVLREIFDEPIHVTDVIEGKHGR